MKMLCWIVKKLAQLTIWQFRPGVVGITGSVGKTSAKVAIESVLKKERRVRASKGNLNNELGLPLTILGGWKEEELKLVSRAQPPGTARIKKIIFWLKAIFLSFLNLFFLPRSRYPEILVLEYGADRPGDIRRLLEIARPSISVITAVGDIPVHVEFFSGPEDVAREKARLIEHLPVASFAILNYDDDTVMNLKERTRAHVVTFGFQKGADVQITGFENKTDGERPVGAAFKLEHGGGFVPVRLDGVFGKSQAYAAGAAAAVGLVFGANLVRISDSLRAGYEPPKGRMNLAAGIKHAYIIDDTYNASPLSTHAALDTLKNLPGKRKIAVLGDMLEIGKYAIEAHERVGRLAGKFLDVLITVGPRAKFIAESARGAGMRKKDISVFNTVEEAKIPVQNLIKKGDLVLVKGSRAMELEKAVEEIRAF